MTASNDLRSRIDGYCIRSVSEYDGEFEIVAAYDGVQSSLSIGDVDRDEAVEVALCGLRLDYVRREIGLGTATAADVRVAIEDAAVLGYGDDDVSDLIEAFMLLASEDELDAWRSEKVRRLAAEMDEAEAGQRADSRPVLVDAEIVELWSNDLTVTGTKRIVSTTPEPDSFELVVADCLPDDDDGCEERGEMCRRALAKAGASVERRRQITEWALKEVVGGVRGFGIERGANGLWHVLMQDGSHAFSLLEGDLPDQPGAARKFVGALYTAWIQGVRGERARALGASEGADLHGVAIDRVIDSAVGRLADVQIKEAREDLRRLRERRASR